MGSIAAGTGERQCRRSRVCDGNSGPSLPALASRDGEPSDTPYMEAPWMEGFDHHNGDVRDRDTGARSEHGGSDGSGTAAPSRSVCQGEAKSDLHFELLQFADYVGLTRAEIKARELLALDVMGQVSTALDEVGRVEATLFGSFSWEVSGERRKPPDAYFSSFLSDVDIAIRVSSGKRRKQAEETGENGARGSQGQPETPRGRSSDRADSPAGMEAQAELASSSGSVESLAPKDGDEVSPCNDNERSPLGKRARAPGTARERTEVGPVASSGGSKADEASLRPTSGSGMPQEAKSTVEGTTDSNRSCPPRLRGESASEASTVDAALGRPDPSPASSGIVHDGIDVCGGKECESRAGTEVEHSKSPEPPQERSPRSISSSDSSSIDVVHRSASAYASTRATSEGLGTLSGDPVQPCREEARGPEKPIGQSQERPSASSSPCSSALGLADPAVSSTSTADSSALEAAADAAKNPICDRRDLDAEEDGTNGSAALQQGVPTEVTSEVVGSLHGAGNASDSGKGRMDVGVAEGLGFFTDSSPDPKLQEMAVTTAAAEKEPTAAEVENTPAADSSTLEAAADTAKNPICDRRDVGAEGGAASASPARQQGVPTEVASEVVGSLNGAANASGSGEGPMDVAIDQGLGFFTDSNPYPKLKQKTKKAMAAAARLAKKREKKGFSRSPVAPDSDTESSATEVEKEERMRSKKRRVTFEGEERTMRGVMQIELRVHGEGGDTAESGGKKRRSTPRSYTIGRLRSIASQLRTQAWVKGLEFRANAKVPIVHMVDKRCGVECDVAWGGDGTGAGLQDPSQEPGPARFASFFPDVFRPLSLFLKVFLHQRGLDKPFCGGLGSFKLYGIIAHHLKLSGVKNGATPESTDLGKVLRGFFKRYAKRGGGAILRENGVFTVGDIEVRLSGVYRAEKVAQAFGAAYQALEGEQHPRGTAKKGALSADWEAPTTSRTSMLQRIIRGRDLQLEREDRLAAIGLPKRSARSSCEPMSNRWSSAQVESLLASIGGQVSVTGVVQGDASIPRGPAKGSSEDTGLDEEGGEGGRERGNEGEGEGCGELWSGRPDKRFVGGATRPAGQGFGGWVMKDFSRKVTPCFRTLGAKLRSFVKEIAACKPHAGAGGEGVVQRRVGDGPGVGVAGEGTVQRRDGNRAGLGVGLSDEAVQAYGPNREARGEGNSCDEPWYGKRDVRFAGRGIRPIGDGFGGWTMEDFVPFKFLKSPFEERRELRKVMKKPFEACDRLTAGKVVFTRKQRQIRTKEKQVMKKPLEAYGIATTGSVVLTQEQIRTKEKQAMKKSLEAYGIATTGSVEQIQAKEKQAMEKSLEAYDTHTTTSVVLTQRQIQIKEKKAVKKAMNAYNRATTGSVMSIQKQFQKQRQAQAKEAKARGETLKRLPKAVRMQLHMQFVEEAKARKKIRNMLKMKEKK